jgi:hypothetical protein
LNNSARFFEIKIEFSSHLWDREKPGLVTLCLHIHKVKKAESFAFSLHQVLHSVSFRLEQSVLFPLDFHLLGLSQTHIGLRAIEPLPLQKLFDGAYLYFGIITVPSWRVEL